MSKDNPVPKLRNYVQMVPLESEILFVERLILQLINF